MEPHEYQVDRKTETMVANQGTNGVAGPHQYQVDRTVGRATARVAPTCQTSIEA